MIQLNIAILDEEEAYLEKLRGYLVRKKETFFKVWTFSRAETYLACEKQSKFDAVVVTAAFLEETEECGKKQKRIFLSEGSIPRQAQNLPVVAKYQSVEKLFAQISALLWQEGTEGEDSLPEHTAELIGVYSPVCCENQMLFSMTMAQILGEREKVLYVNLMEHSGFYQVTGEEISEDVGDLLYGMLGREQEFTAGLHRIRRSFLNFDYLPPAVNPEHLSEISKPLYEQLLLALKNRSGYDVVILDFGRVFLGFAEMLSILGNLYCLGKEGILNRYRMEEFCEYLGKECESAARHQKNLFLPEWMPGREETNLMESSLYGGMGDYIRRCLYGGMEVG